MPRKPLRYLCHATHHGQVIAGPHQDPNEVERHAWDYLRAYVRRHHTDRMALMKAEREVNHVGSVQLIVRGPDRFPVAIVHLGGGLFEVE